MIRKCLFLRRVGTSPLIHSRRRKLLTLAIETSCDDTGVAVLEKHHNGSATLHYHEKITSDNRIYGGVYPIAAHEGHQKSLAILIQKALQKLSVQPHNGEPYKNALAIESKDGTHIRWKPDFITVTRGPGMRSNLLTGMDTAKGLAVAWQIPLLGVNHMQAHALTPRLISALKSAKTNASDFQNDPAFPFLTLLVSGGHSMLVQSKSLCDHEIIANTTDLAIGDVIDKSAREILPESYLRTATDVMYGRLLESFAFPYKASGHNYTPPTSFMKPRDGKQWGYDWLINPPYSAPGPSGAIGHSHLFTFSGIGEAAKRIVGKRPNMDETERRVLARETMALAFEHLASRVIFALQRPDIKCTQTIVVSGGVASNQFLKTILRAVLDTKGYENVRLVFPPIEFCTDNAAMIAWTGIEMFEEGWTTDLDAMVVKKWAVDASADDGGILGIGGWRNILHT